MNEAAVMTIWLAVRVVSGNMYLECILKNIRNHQCNYNNRWVGVMLIRRKQNCRHSEAVQIPDILVLIDQRVIKSE